MNTELSNQIQEAFACVAQPQPSELLAEEKSISRPTVTENFGGKSRDELPSRLTSYEAEDLFYMSPRALSYFLPVFLCHLLKDSARLEDCLVEQMIALLDVRRFRSSQQFKDECTSGQREAVADWLSFIVQNAENYCLSDEDFEMVTALEQGWRHA